MNEQIRADFDEWHLTEHGFRSVWHKHAEEYDHDEVQERWETWQAAHARYAGSGEETIQRLRGQLQNCVNHIERLKRHHPRETEKLEACVQSANKCLYETLHGINPPAQPKVPDGMVQVRIDDLRKALGAVQIPPWSSSYKDHPEALKRLAQVAQDALSAQENSK